MNKKKLFIIIGIVIFIILFLIFLYRVSIYNFFQNMKLKMSVKNEEKYDYILYFERYNHCGEYLKVYKEQNKIVYDNGWDPLGQVKFKLGRYNSYKKYKIKELQESDIKLIEKYLKNKKYSSNDNSIYSEDIYNTLFINDMSNFNREKIIKDYRNNARDLYTLLERVKE